MAELAINGGERCVTQPVKVKWPITDERDAEHVAEVVRAGRGGWCRLGLEDGEVSSFEREWADYHDAKHCLAVNNGTVAIECALQGLGLRPGDEVIVPAVTFVASASGVLMARGIPVFADVIPETCQIDPDDIERKVTERTRGVVVVHYGGYPADMGRITEIAGKHGLFVLEDCAHAQGSEWEGRKVGAIGDVGTFSFQGSKSLTCGEGGAIVTDRDNVYKACWAYHHIGRGLDAEKYEHETVGPNLRLSEVQGALLRTQLEKLQAQVEQRMAMAAFLSEGLQEIPGVEPLKEDERITQRVCYFYVMRFDEETWGCSKDDFVRAFAAEGVPMFSGYWSTVYELPVFANNRYDSTGYPVVEGEGYGRVVDYKDVRCPNAELVTHHQHLTFTTHSLLYRKYAEDALAVFRKLWENRAELKDGEAGKG
ncbi:MAG: DegT/DnrJ/EryC1/StrS family aminotransferase [Candidatus Brocadiae bacterium]|nr:DegT/DnrJ/EryC1/StrS family aminotransferase [Candidatus Brocadiia bacterium]